MKYRDIKITDPCVEIVYVRFQGYLSKKKCMLSGIKINSNVDLKKKKTSKQVNLGNCINASYPTIFFRVLTYIRIYKIYLLKRLRKSYITSMVPLPSAILQPDIRNGFLESL